MTMWSFFTVAWRWEPSVLIGCSALLWMYIGMLRARMSGKTVVFAAGVIVLLLTLISPLDTLGDTYLFSAHMVQHLLLVLAVPPLLLLGIPSWYAERVFGQPWLSRLERGFCQPLLTWGLGMGSLWLWHAPPLYNAALAHEALHILEHLCFLVTAALFWWPVLTPLETRRLRPLAALFYLTAAAIANSLLGFLLTFAPPDIYPAYLAPSDTFGILPLLRDAWGLSPEVDQQLGGLLMWVPGGLVFLGAILATLARWYRMPEEDVSTGGRRYITEDKELT